MNVGIIGCGLIGYKRAKSLNKKNIVGCYDKNKKSSKKFSEEFNCFDFKNIKELVTNKKISAVIICTYHNTLYNFAKLCLENNKNILIEKPGAKNLKELLKLSELSKKFKHLKIHIGYNHRFHPAIISAKKMIDKNILGKIMYIRARYGHGARLNYNREWRMSKNISGGGELIDQGSHLIDLSRFFLGNLSVKSSLLKRFFWKSNVDDNAFLTLGNKNENVAFLHCSCTEWKNKFSFEIFLKYGKLEISGLGGSYGVETLTCFKMKKKMGKPNIKVWKYKGRDISWKNEIDYFSKILSDGQESQSNVSNALENMRIINHCYLKNKL